MEISLIWAMTNEGVIGKENALPWHLPEELQYFKKITLNKTIIMGRKTFESMKKKPLPHRKNIILTQEKDYHAVGCEVVHSVDDALKVAEKSAEKHSDNSEVMVIGGSNIFQQFLPLATRLYITLIHHPYSGDTFFGPIDWNQWKLVKENPGEQFTTKVFERR